MNCITPFFNKHIHLAPQLFTFTDNYAKNKKKYFDRKNYEQQQRTEH